MKNKVIGIDASRAFVGEKTGTENYSYQLVKALVKSECQFKFRLYTKTDSIVVIPAVEPESSVDPEFPNQGSGQASSGQVNRGSESGMTIKGINWPRFWTQGGLAVETWHNPPDLLFIPAHVIPFFKNPAVPAVVTVHDLRTEFLPQHESLVQKIYLNKYTEMLRAKLAKHIIAVSESTKKDVIKRLGVEEDKVSVVYEGIDDRRFHKGIKNQEARIKSVKSKYGIEGQYILFVGTIQPRKNLVRLIEALAKFVHGGFAAPRETSLIIAGGKGWGTDEIYAAPRKFGVEDKVKFVGYVNDVDLPYLYAGAEIFAFPSLYEGFGLPVLEAMAVGTPVLTSRVSSLPEVGGKAAYYVNPESVSDIVNGLSRVMMQSKLRQQMSDRGYGQVEKFSWEKAAEETCKVFRRVLSSRT